MKRRNSTKLLALLLTLCVLLSGMIGTAVSATESEGFAITLDESNIVYNEMMHLAFTLNGENTLADGNTAGIIFWDDTVTEAPALKNATYISFEKKTDTKGNEYISSQPIPAPKIATAMKIACCIKDANGNISFGDITDYCIADYLESRLADETITKAQRNLYEKTIAYGIAAGAVFN